MVLFPSDTWDAEKLVFVSHPWSSRVVPFLQLSSTYDCLIWFAVLRGTLAQDVGDVLIADFGLTKDSATFQERGNEWQEGSLLILSVQCKEKHLVVFGTGIHGICHRKCVIANVKMMTMSLCHTQAVGASLQRSGLALLRPPAGTEQRLKEILMALAELMGGAFGLSVNQHPVISCYIRSMLTGCASRIFYESC